MLGDLNWGLKTKGDLNLVSKLFLTYKAVLAKQKLLKTNSKRFVFDERDFILPDSFLVKTTLEFLHDTHKQFIINHCLRTYLFGTIIGKSESIKIDKELFLISALLHDIGLTEKHQFIHRNCNCFAIEGAIEAGIFLEKQKFDKTKTLIVQDAISLHLNINLPSLLPEAYLLNKGAAVDVVGQELNNFSSECISKVIETYPRLNFKTEFHTIMKKQCSERPKSRTAFLYNNGFGGLIKKAGFKE